MQTLVVEVAKSLRTGGLIIDYFAPLRPGTFMRIPDVKEPAMRSAFHRLRVSGRKGTPDIELAREALDLVNALYRTRSPRTFRAATLRALVKALHDQDWWTAGNAPRLLDSNDDEAEQIAHVVMNAVRGAANATGAHPYSLVTKWLHFVLPDTFAIFDSYVAGWIDSWAKENLDYLPRRHPDRRRFQANVLKATDGSGYGGIVDFYRLYWQSARAAGVAAKIEARCHNLEERLGAVDGGRGARFNEVDALDKHVWINVARS